MKIVLSLGGSIINPKIINLKFLKQFKKIILKSKHEFIIICGGGTIAREYQTAGKELKIPSLRLDELGMKATELNAELISTLFNVRRKKTIEEIVRSKEKIIVSNGLFPGVTTDYDAVAIAGLIQAKMVINISNVAGIYNKNPSKYKDAKLLKNLSYLKLLELANKFELGCGTHFIFDLAATKLAQRAKIKIISLAGLNNLEKAINDKKFIGSTVK